ncbi:uncharacterized protein LOC122974404 [Thunnus albacares]|uniref:uncharacterized protein LOC122974404 n=1 Tax=Thunnus albacares TaxID=8236 RepID=UPI001CF64489|nr:uncharacterized protein LOC122974404 [Thunnus albacares]
MTDITQLVLLLCLCGTLADQTFTQNDITAPESIQSDIMAELKELRDMVMEQKEELKATKAALDTQRTLMGDLRRDNSALRASQHATATQVDRLEKENGMLMATIKTRKEDKAPEMTSMQRLKTIPKVAFSVALDCPGGDTYGPFDTLTKVIFRWVYINIGNAYNPVTGSFTAPMRGVYYFRFSGIDDRAYKWMGVFLYKNDQSVKCKQLENGEGHLNLSFTVILQLERGDVTDIRIFPDTRFAPSASGDINLSGFLLFPL